jgi:hypothetical protein
VACHIRAVFCAPAALLATKMLKSCDSQQANYCAEGRSQHSLSQVLQTTVVTPLKKMLTQDIQAATHANAHRGCTQGMNAQTHKAMGHVP